MRWFLCWLTLLCCPGVVLASYDCACCLEDRFPIRFGFVAGFSFFGHETIFLQQIPEPLRLVRYHGGYALIPEDSVALTPVGTYPVTFIVTAWNIATLQLGYEFSQGWAEQKLHKDNTWLTGPSYAIEARQTLLKPSIELGLATPLIHDHFQFNARYGWFFGNIDLVHETIDDYNNSETIRMSRFGEYTSKRARLGVIAIGDGDHGTCLRLGFFVGWTLTTNVRLFGLLNEAEVRTRENVPFGGFEIGFTF